MKLYRYVGPKSIAERTRGAPGGTSIASQQDIIAWAKASGQSPGIDRCIIATFIVDESGTLRVADRRSEHVACAGGVPVRSAGEITLQFEGDSVHVVAVSNQSTGYCPEEESWPDVAKALSKAGFTVPSGFSLACVFRKCPQCKSTILVKNGEYECGICHSELPVANNCQDEDH